MSAIAGAGNSTVIVRVNANNTAKADEQTVCCCLLARSCADLIGKSAVTCTHLLLDFAVAVDNDTEVLAAFLLVSFMRCLPVYSRDKITLGFP